MYSVYLLATIFSFFFMYTHAEYCEGLGSEILNRFERIGDSYYLIDASTKVNWFTAVQLCRRLGGNLASIDSPAELDALQTILLDRNYHQNGEWTDRFWLSGNDLEENGKYIWLRTGKSIPLDRNWSKGEPSSPGEEDCIEIWYEEGKYNLNDVPCSELMGFICQTDELTQRRHKTVEFLYKSLKLYAKCEK